MSALQERRFAHEPVICKQNGRYKVYCRCGVQSKGKLDDLLSATKAHSEHVGLVEMKRKQVMN